MTFSISLSIVLRRTMGLNTWGKSYDILLGFNITMIVEILKYKGQKPKLKYKFAMLTKFFKHVLSLKIYLRWLYESLLGPDTGELFHLAITMMNSSLENWFQGKEGKDISFSRMFSLILQYWAILKEICSVCHRLLIYKHSWLLYLMVLLASNFYLLTQFINSQEPCFLFTISWILRLKKVLFVILTVLWKVFQSSRLLVIL